jgi:hypothetical protein
MHVTREPYLDPVTKTTRMVVITITREDQGAYAFDARWEDGDGHIASGQHVSTSLEDTLAAARMGVADVLRPF